MIDIENALFTEVKKALVDAFPNISVEGSEDYVPSKFPYVSFVENDNSTNKRTIDSSGVEKYVRVTYLVNIYSAKAVGKKQEAKKILAVIDEIMVGYGFVRQTDRPMKTDDPSLARRVARYRGIVSNANEIYRG